MMYCWKKSIPGQFIIFILVALVGGQSAAYLVSCHQREIAIRQVVESDFVARTDALVSMLNSVPEKMREGALLAASTGTARFWTTQNDPTTLPAEWYGAANAYLSLAGPSLAEASSNTKEELLRLQKQFSTGSDLSAWGPLYAGSMKSAQSAHFSDEKGMGIVQQLPSGTWLNAAYYRETPSMLWSAQTLLSLGVMVIAVSLIGVLIANRIARPLRRLTLSAEALGRGEVTDLSAPNAPEDIQRLYEAFDLMQTRLRRFVDDRTRMLAAIGHDLRTPLTTLRLRAEFVQDRELQRRILATVDEMQTMTEATLSFARSDAITEKTKNVDLAALLDSLCGDLAELGHDVSFVETDRLSYRCRPDSIRRAVRNLVENALRYAGSAVVSLEVVPNGIEIRVDDRGPGIPEDRREEVFAPFHRLEDSRSRDTGGVGLGLSIARAIVRHHGGDVALSANNPGLRVSVLLPLSPATALAA